REVLEREVLERLQLERELLVRKQLERELVVRKQLERLLLERGQLERLLVDVASKGGPRAGDPVPGALPRSRAWGRSHRHNSGPGRTDSS
ncbi:MAG TPA: hypothetical protein VEM93_09620, partial [Actinomycetota bacterium]|nr:hypothetical protein [Actinomycetota bacterium]